MTSWLNIKITYLQETRQILVPVLKKEKKKVNVAQFKRESELDTESKRKKEKLVWHLFPLSIFHQERFSHDLLVKYQDHLQSGKSTELSTCIEKRGKRLT